MSNLIGQIVVNPPKPRPGETVRVEVMDAAGKPFPDSARNVRVNGVVGSVQYLQFPRVGTRRISADVTGADGATEQTSSLVEVAGDPVTFLSDRNFDELAMIQAKQTGENPYAVTFNLGWPGDLPPQRARPPRATSPAAGGRAGVVRTSAAKANISSAAIKSIAGRTMIKPAMGAMPALRLNIAPIAAKVGDLALSDLAGAVPKQEQRYEWDFGDGTTAVTASPCVAHDYFATLDHAAGNGRFVVTCHVVHSGVTVKRTLTLHSAYAISKRTGCIVPHVVADVFAQKRHNKFAASFVVHNPEPVPLVIDRMSLAPHRDADTDMCLHQPSVALDRPITIAPRSSHLFGVNLPCIVGTPNAHELPHDIGAFTVTFSGSAGRVPVRCSTVFDIPVEQQMRKPQVPPAARAAWPWDQVEKGIQALGQPHGVNVVLDRKTGTLAVSLGPLSAKPFAKETLQWASELLGKVYAPVEPAPSRASAGSQKPALGNIGAFKLNPGLLGLGAGGNGPAGMPHNVPAPPPPPPEGEPVAPGAICDPENISDADLSKAQAAHLVCQLSSKSEDTKTRRIDARWVNARKGDIILSPGGDGIVGGLMLQLDPPQLYGHCGIMTKNFREITHSTGSQKRLEHHLAGISGSEGLEPDALKYMWPGAITQTVENSIVGEEFPNPDPNPDGDLPKTYTLSPFGSSAASVMLFGNMVVIPPMVVKPDPSLDSPQVRSALHAIADEALNSAGGPNKIGKYHYSWYSYTDPTIGLKAPAGPEAGWAKGTRPTCCSSFVWLMAKKHGAHFETTNPLAVPADLEAGDVGTGLGQGAQVKPTGSVDGLYTYTAKERLHAGQWLYDYMAHMTAEIAGGFLDFWTDASGDLASQFLNAFANGNCDGKDSDAWKDAKDADAVSPDNILWWDGPERGGLWGHAVPAIFRQPRIEDFTISRWTPAQGPGKIHGTVFFHNGKPAKYATVYIGGFWTTADADGRYTLNPGQGSYTLRAYADYPLTQSSENPSPRNLIHESVQQPVKLATADMVHDIHLELPDGESRMVWVELDFKGRDDEWGASDEFWHNKLDPHSRSITLQVGPSYKTDSRDLAPYKWGGELRAEFSVTAKLKADKAIEFTVHGILYEGTSEDTDDFAGKGTITFTVPSWKWVQQELKIENTAEDCPEDRARLTVKVHNWPDVS